MQSCTLSWYYPEGEMCERNDNIRVSFRKVVYVLLLPLLRLYKRYVSFTKIFQLQPEVISENLIEISQPATRFGHNL